MKTSQRKQFLLYQQFIIISLHCFIYFLCFPSIGYSQENQQKAIFKSDTQEHSITLEIAKTLQEKMRGLMFRKELADNTGMLFLYDKPAQIGIWMKNTEIPLDIIFIDCAYKIVKLATRLPYTLDVTYAPKKICKIIEVNAGLIDKIGLKVGQEVIFYPQM